MSNNRNILTATQADVATFTLLSEGQEVSRAYHVVSLVVNREVNRVPSATLILMDGEAAKETFEISDRNEFVPGKNIEIKAGYRSSEKRIFKGIVVRHSIKIRKNGSFLILDCKDLSVKMTVGTKNKYFIQQKDSEIMEALIRQNGLLFKVEPTSKPHREVVQMDMTDWDFMMMRADAIGKLVFAEDGKITIAKPDFNQEPVQTVVFGSSLLELDAEIDARFQFQTTKGYSWDAAGQDLTVAEGKKSPANKLGNLKEEDLAQVIGAEAKLQHGGDVEKSELQAWADTARQKAQMAKVKGRAKFQGTEKVKPGVIVRLMGIGNRFKGDAYITGVRHSISDGNWETDVQFGLDPEWYAKKTGLSGTNTGWVVPLSGLHAGVVTALENDPDGEDRIKVKLPLINKNAEGTWARVASLDAGANRGAFFRPDIGDEVVVGFLGGDVHHPVVLGMMNSSAKPAPLDASNDNPQKGFVSRSGMKWLMDDATINSSFETPLGNKIRLSEKNKGIVIEDQNGNSITLDTNGITIKSAKDIKVTAAVKTEIGGRKLKIAAQSGMEVNGGATLKLEAGGLTELKGGLVKIN
ncbi:MAG: type VI secretion system tip protein VgrG [Spirosomataceae bacterium]